MLTDEQQVRTLGLRPLAQVGSGTCAAPRFLHTTVQFKKRGSLTLLPHRAACTNTAVAKAKGP